jgi:YidC/Oxa1 family membrane protein insertase
MGGGDRYFRPRSAKARPGVLPPASAAIASEVLAQLPRGAQPQQEVAVSSLVMSVPGPLSPVNRFLIYAGPSEYFRLDRLEVPLERAVDLGWSWLLPFSKALLQLLIWTYGVVQNYGVAIIILASLVRLLLHPLNAASLKSMRSLQKLQPEVERLKQKYKGDAQAMNAAMMALYKEHKVNPAGGCLPLVLQMPLFIALYNVLFNAIELRQAPFVAWMIDPSAPDHVFRSPAARAPVADPDGRTGVCSRSHRHRPSSARPYIMNVHAGVLLQPALRARALLDGDEPAHRVPELAGLPAGWRADSHRHRHAGNRHGGRRATAKGLTPSPRVPMASEVGTG